MPEKGSKGKNYAAYHKEKSAKAKLKIAVDTLIPQVNSFEELLSRLQGLGYEIKRGKYVSCLVPGQERFTRLKTIGADYTEEAIKERIEGKRTRAAKAPQADRGVSLLIDIENSIKAAQSRGYEQWAKIHNLKQAAKTMNFITERKIEQYADLTAKIAEIQTESEQAADALKGVEKRLSDMALLIKHIATYQKTKPIYDAYCKAKNKEQYRAGHESSIILFEAATKALKEAGVSGKLPNLAALQAEYGKLQIVKGTTMAGKAMLTLDNALLDASPDGVSIHNCGLLRIKKDVSPERILDLVQTCNCGCILCTPEQKGAVELVSRNAGFIGDLKEKSGSEGGGGMLAMLKQAANTKVANADLYVL